MVTALLVVSNRYEMWSSPPIPFDEHRFVDFGGEELHVGAVIMRTDVSSDYREVQICSRTTPGRTPARSPRNRSSGAVGRVRRACDLGA